MPLEAFMNLLKLTIHAAVVGLVALQLTAVQAVALTETVFQGFALDNPTTSEREGWAYTNNSVGGVSENPQTGQWRLTHQGTTYDTYCIDPLQALRFGDLYRSFTMVGAIAGDSMSFTPAQLERINKLYESSYDAGRQSADASAAFQLAIWEILYDSNLDITEGNFFTITGSNPTDTSAEVLELTQGMLLGLDERSVGNWEFHRLVNPVIQDQLLASRVPVPSSVLLLALGLFGLIKRRS